MPDLTNNILEERKHFALKCLSNFRNTFCKYFGNFFPESSDSPSYISIYATGSYGRLEASEHSDLDLFLIHHATDSGHKLRNIDTTLLQACVIQTLRNCSFQDPSDDGRFLKIHDTEDIVRHLGGPRDDYENHFTARMLFLLEARSVRGDEIFREARQHILSAYYNDYHDHIPEFRPVFLLNDILRFWRTLCLNYEHKRSRESADADEKAKAHLRNLKLKYSRLITCYSLVIWLCRNKSADMNKVMEGIQLTPIDRLKDSLPEDTYRKIVQRYVEFLDFTGRPKQAVLNDIGDPSIRKELFEKANEFGKLIFYALLNSGEKADLLRFLLV